MNRYRNGNGWDGRQDPLEYSRMVKDARNAQRRAQRHNGPRHTDEIVQEFIDQMEEIANGGGPSKEQSMSDLELLKDFSDART